ncbi:MAG: transposase [Rhodobacteraceae bacterium]|nr:transposase [Paracoccaceae bacterium]
MNWQDSAPGKQIQNAFVESFIGKLRDERLKEHISGNLAEAGKIIKNWGTDYSKRPPFISLGGLAPVVCATLYRAPPVWLERRTVSAQQAWTAIKTQQRTETGSPSKRPGSKGWVTRSIRHRSPSRPQSVAKGARFQMFASTEYHKTIKNSVSLNF